LLEDPYSVGKGKRGGDACRKGRGTSQEGTSVDYKLYWGPKG